MQVVKYYYIYVYGHCILVPIQWHQYHVKKRLIINYIPGSNLLFWNSKGIESWNLAQIQVNIIENDSRNIKF